MKQSNVRISYMLHLLLMLMIQPRFVHSAVIQLKKGLKQGLKKESDAKMLLTDISCIQSTETDSCSKLVYKALKQAACRDIDAGQRSKQ